MFLCIISYFSSLVVSGMGLLSILSFITVAATFFGGFITTLMIRWRQLAFPVEYYLRKMNSGFSQRDIELTLCICVAGTWFVHIIQHATDVPDVQKPQWTRYYVVSLLDYCNTLSIWVDNAIHSLLKFTWHPKLYVGDTW